MLYPNRLGLSIAFLCLGLGTSALADDKIDRVKEGLLDYDDSIYLGDALESYAGCIDGTQEWSLQKGSKGREFVQYSCTLKEGYGFTPQQTEYFLADTQILVQLLEGSIALYRNNPQYQEEMAELGDIRFRKLAQLAFDIAPTGQKLELQFSLSKRDESFELAYTGLEVHYNGQAPDVVGSFWINMDSMRQIYGDEALFSPELYPLSTEFCNEFLSSLIFARTEAKGDTANYRQSKGTTKALISTGERVPFPESSTQADDGYIDEDLVVAPDSIEGELTGSWKIHDTNYKLLVNLTEEPYFVDMYESGKRKFLAFVKVSSREADEITVMPFDPNSKADIDSQVMTFMMIRDPRVYGNASFQLNKRLPGTLLRIGPLHYKQIEHVKNTATQRKKKKK